MSLDDRFSTTKKGGAAKAMKQMEKVYGKKKGEEVFAKTVEKRTGAPGLKDAMAKRKRGKAGKAFPKGKVPPGKPDKFGGKQAIPFGKKGEDVPEGKDKGKDNAPPWAKGKKSGKGNTAGKTAQAWGKKM